ncbi:uncharacterized protein LOC132973606 [Labrus mixtus]|uniref:uncharacterized protein LOC132973606 n=1 Tax=Labrus mixtus TaxID=508554 RepID=UPI0029BFBDCE|nr:uncharacterized protein LOC132973606 [Labrus mixtus]
MMMLWICLLIGSITCSPVNKVYKPDTGAPADTLYMPLSAPASGRGESSDLGSSSSLPSQFNPRAVYSAGLGSYSGSRAGYDSPKTAEGNSGGYYAAEVYTGPEVVKYGVAYVPSHGSASSAPGGSYGGKAAGSYQPEGSYGSVSAPGDENGDSGSAIDYVGEPQPVLSDVSDLEPVYSFSSRSRYQRGSATFVQTHYSPGDPFFPPMPVYNPPMKTGSKQGSPAEAPPKGGN